MEFRDYLIVYQLKCYLYFRYGRVREGLAEGDGGTLQLVQAILTGMVTVGISTVHTRDIMITKIPGKYIDYADYFVMSKFICTVHEHTQWYIYFCTQAKAVMGLQLV